MESEDDNWVIRGKKFFKRSVYVYAMAVLFLLTYIATTEVAERTGSPVTHTADAVIAVGAGCIAIGGFWRIRGNGARANNYPNLLFGVGGLVIASATLARFFE